MQNTHISAFFSGGTLFFADTGDICVRTLIAGSGTGVNTCGGHIYIYIYTQVYLMCMIYACMYTCIHACIYHTHKIYLCIYIYIYMTATGVHTRARSCN